MKKPQILLIATFLILGIIGFWYFDLLPKSKQSPFRVVSDEAILVLDTEDAVGLWNQWANQPFWEILTSIPAMSSAGSQLLILDSLAGKSGNLQRSLKGRKFVMALFPVSKEDLDWLFVVELDKANQGGLLENIKKEFSSENRLRLRNYSGEEILEFLTEKKDQSFSLAVVNNLLIGSYTSFLVEDGIRHAQNRSLTNFSNTFKEINKTGAKGFARISLTNKGLTNLSQALGSEKEGLPFGIFKNNPFSLHLSLNFEENNLALDGMLFTSTSLPFFKNPSIDSKQDWIQYIPNKTADILSLHFPNGKDLLAPFETDFPFRSTILGEIDQALIHQGFFDRLSGKMVFLNMEKMLRAPQEKVILLETEESDTQWELLKSFARRENLDGSIMEDVYLGRNILWIGEDDFPAYLFQSDISGFPDTYLTYKDDLLVMANSNKAIRSWIDAIHRDDVWAKSVKKKKDALIFGQDSQVSFFLDIRKKWPMLLEFSSPGWNSFFQKHASTLQIFDKVQFEITEEKNQHSVKANIRYDLDRPESQAIINIRENRVLEFPESLVQGPFVIRNFNDQSDEVLVQDIRNQLYLLTTDGEIVFTEFLDGPIISDVFQIDYYQNGKLQLLMATANSIYGIDRLGNPLPGFPMKLTDSRMTHFNLLDYDRDRNYRMFISTEDGNLYLSDIKGELLPDWNPKVLGMPLAAIPSHHRVAGVGDRMIALGKNGQLFFFNRRGLIESGSPIRFGDSFNSDYVVLDRGSAKESSLLTVSEKGEVVQANFLGEIAFREQLLRPDRESTFHLIKDANSMDYLFAVHEFGRITLLDKEFQTRFVKNIRSESLSFQYFDFGSGNQLFVVLDPIQEFAYLYDLKGNLLNERPLDASGPIEVSFTSSRNEILIRTIAGKKLIEYSFPL